MKVFISYRRTTTAHVQNRLYRKLAEAFGAGQITRDTEFPPGDFEATLQASLKNCDVVLALIGPQWHTLTDDQGKRRLDDKHDWVRREIETGLRNRKIEVIPVLIDDTKMPADEALPRSLRRQRFTKQQASRLRRDPDFDHDVDRLIERLKSLRRTRKRGVPRAAKVTALSLALGLGVFGVGIWQRPALCDSDVLARADQSTFVCAVLPDLFGTADEGQGATSDAPEATPNTEAPDDTAPDDASVPVGDSTP